MIGGGGKTIVVLAIILFSSALALAADEKQTEKQTDVHVVLPPNLAIPKSAVTIFRAPDEKNDWPMVQTEAPRGQQQDVTVSLPPGKYIAEAGGTTDDAVVLLRSAPFTVPATDHVTLTAERHSCDAVIGGSSAHMRQMAIRRCGNGEIRWEAEDARPPTVILSPGQSYVLSCVADFGHKSMAVWLPIAKIADTAIHFTDANASHSLKFAIRSGTPPLASSRVTLNFPDCRVSIDDPAEHAVFVTNRDRALVSYQIETAAKEKFVFHRDAQMIDRSSVFEFGGPLKPRLFAGFIWADNGKWDAGDVVTRLELTDATGRLLDAKQSSCDLLDEKFYCPTADQRLPLDQNKPGWKGFQAESILAVIHYNYGGRPITADCHGEGLIRVHSEHFSIGTPPQWMFKAKQFLSMMEAVRLLTQKNTGRPGPETFKVDWRSNSNNAKSIIGSARGGAHNIWMSFPFWTFSGFWDPFVEPWFGNKDPYVCHETLHTFGYNHGEEMSHLEWRGEDQYRALRWKAVDTGVWSVWADPVRVDAAK